MKNVRLSLIALAFIATLSPGRAHSADEHAAHHPDAAAAPASGASTAHAKTARARTAPEAVVASPRDRQMQAMRAMHDRMANAKSMDERRGLLAEQMASMESGMAMMDGMDARGPSAPAPGSGASAPAGMGMGMGGMPARHAAMVERMEMMQMMMRLMMDRLSVEPAQ